MSVRNWLRRRTRISSNPLVSVVLPTFNSSKFIHSTIDSLLSQSHANIEVVVVDDCSTDNTRTLLEDLSKKHSQIRVHGNQQNRGPGVCRNLGIRQCSGELITFFDHDDFQECDRFEQMIHRLQDDPADVCISAYADVDPDGNHINTYDFPWIDDDMPFRMRDEIKIHYHMFPPWSKIYRTDYVLENHILFAEQNVRFDDVLFHSTCVLSPGTAVIHPVSCYFHRVGIGSITDQFGRNEHRFNDFVSSFNQSINTNHPNVSKQQKLEYWTRLIVKVNRVEYSGKTDDQIREWLVKKTFLHGDEL